MIHKKKIVLFLLAVFWAPFLIAQGKLMLAGGGGESAGGWSDAPYQWVVQNSPNKKIAVITYDSGATDWIPNYFKSFGAAWCRNFIISSKSAADLQSVYDSLITYDGIFIKGGDQKLYYQYYKGTKTQEAIQAIFNRGGVISGTSAGTAILSPIVYTAESASVDPAAALLNSYNSQITLKDDFLNTLPDRFIYDTHFIERGRFGRLPAFMASWYRKTKEIATGIGVDDHTALCIDSDKKATVYGTGAVSFMYNLNETKPYDTTVSILRTDRMKMVQLTHGCTIDFNNGSITGLSDFIQPGPEKENQRYTLLFSGTDYPSDNAFDHFVNQAANKTDPVVIVTGSSLTRANEVKTKLESLGATDVTIIQAIASKQNDAVTGDKINKARKLFVINNDCYIFINFIQGGGNGSLLQNKLKSSEMISFFAGDNARFAGKTIIHKYTGFGYTSYNGNLEFIPGLKLLANTAIMPNAFISAETYENTVSGLPYAMMKDSIRHGIYITGNTFAAYSFTNDGKSFFKNHSGSYPLIVLKNNGTKAGFANQGPNTNSRNIAAFESMDIRFAGISDTITISTEVPLSVLEHERLQMRVYPNPVQNILFVEGKAQKYQLILTDLNGKTIKNKEFFTKTEINTKSLLPGIYIVSISDPEQKLRFSKKLIINR